MTYSAVIFFDGDPVPAQVLTDMSAAVADLSNLYRGSTTLGASAASVTISGIPSNLRNLDLRVSARGDVAAQFTNLSIRVNGDSSAVYRYFNRFVQNTSAMDTGAATTGAGQAFVSYVPAASSTSGIFGCMEARFSGWDNPRTNGLTVESKGGYMDLSTNCLQNLTIGQYSGAGPYTSLLILPGSGNFIAGSEFMVTGIL